MFLFILFCTAVAVLLCYFGVLECVWNTYYRKLITRTFDTPLELDGTCTSEKTSSPLR